jgi:Rrf2 family transcriptional regulator, cysteine metabolism repressor
MASAMSTIISKKVSYAVRAVLELAKRKGQTPMRVADIAQAQAIPARFLENILNQLKQARITRSVRGKEGGFVLLRPSAELTVGDIVRVIEGPLKAVDCQTGRPRCPFKGCCVFNDVWEQAGTAFFAVLDGTTFQALVERDAALERPGTPSYDI